MFTRTLQTIQNSTTLIASFTIDGVHQEFEIRRLNVEREHYIVLTKQSLARKHLWEDVKVVTEVLNRLGRNDFRISIARQYPDLIEVQDEIKQQIIKFIQQQKSTV